uniref:Uncharacterized protein n=1 Tax=Solanum tuberosum TaxID=4113 RepID=M1AEG3_SOLTU
MLRKQYCEVLQQKLSIPAMTCLAECQIQGHRTKDKLQVLEEHTTPLRSQAKKSKKYTNSFQYFISLAK